jgi:hypothetical protein
MCTCIRQNLGTEVVVQMGLCPFVEEMNIEIAE